MDERDYVISENDRLRKAIDYIQAEVSKSPNMTGAIAEMNKLLAKP